VRATYPSLALRVADSGAAARREQRRRCRNAGNERAAMVMTRQYLAGELSVLLAQLEGLATSHTGACSAALLRREAETLPPAALGPVAVRALRLIDEFCWCSLAGGDIALFVRQTDLGARLFEFGVCAGLFDEV
jgi:hypothetical protein